MRSLKIFFALAALFSLATVSFAGESADSAAVRRKFDRGLDSDNSFVFVPKGTVMSGLSFSYSNYDFGNFKFLVIDKLTASGATFGLAPHVSYFIKNNLSVGARFDYNSSNFSLGGASVNISDELGMDFTNYNILSRSYFGSVTLRNYLPIGRSTRFGFFTEVRLSGGYGESKQYEVVDVHKYGTFQKSIQLELGLIPGMAVFVTNDVAFEVSVGVLGFDYKKVTQFTNQVYEGSYEKSGANFKINIFNIEFGVTFYIPTGNKKGGQA